MSFNLCFHYLLLHNNYPQKWQLKTTVNIYFTQFLWLRKFRVLGGSGSGCLRILSGNSKGQYNWWLPQLIFTLLYFLKICFISHIQQSSEGPNGSGGPASQTAHSATDKMLLLLGSGLSSSPSVLLYKAVRVFHDMWLSSSWAVPGSTTWKPHVFLLSTIRCHTHYSYSVLLAVTGPPHWMGEVGITGGHTTTMCKLEPTYCLKGISAATINKEMIFQKSMSRLTYLRTQFYILFL